MIVNPQKLIKINCSDNINGDVQINYTLDAIFIPFTKRINNLKVLLNELLLFKGMIYIIPSNEYDSELVKNDLTDNVKLLPIKNFEFINYYNNLGTSNHKYIHYQSSWDLPIKRNYAILYSREQKINNILLLDDDIRNLTPDILKNGCNLLKNNSVSGCFVDNEIDTSILGHLQKRAGETFYPFLSGSFLFIKPLSVKSFFPNIYNEDWLFMMPYIFDNSICSFGNVSQRDNDSLGDINRVKLQEFGDIIAEGLYTLIHLGEYSQRFETSYWNEVIKERRYIFDALLKTLLDTTYRTLIYTAIETNKNIQPEYCAEFINVLENDILKWNNYLN